MHVLVVCDDCNDPAAPNREGRGGSTFQSPNLSQTLEILSYINEIHSYGSKNPCLKVSESENTI